MTQPTTPLRPEAKPPVHSTMPLLLALATALLAGALGGFLMHSVLPGDDPPPPTSEVRRSVLIPPCGGHTYGGSYFHFVPNRPEKPL